MCPTYPGNLVKNRSRTLYTALTAAARAMIQQQHDSSYTQQTRGLSIYLSIYIYLSILFIYLSICPPRELYHKSGNDLRDLSPSCKSITKSEREYKRAAFDLNIRLETGPALAVRVHILNLSTADGGVLARRDALI